MPWERQAKLKLIANELGLDLFSSAFDETAVDFLERMGVPAHKVSSFELVDIPLIQTMARTWKPFIMSTGMGSMDEIDEAVGTARGAGATQIALLKCTSAYPASPEQLNLRTIPYLAAHAGLPVGLSDHRMGVAAPVTAIALGACIIETLPRLSRSSGSRQASASRSEFKAMADAVRIAERSLGQARSGAKPKRRRQPSFPRSLFVVADMKCGETFTEQNVRSIRPGHGLHTRHLGEILESRQRGKFKVALH